MATPLELPFPPLVIIAAPQVIEWTALEDRIKARIAKGVSICITAEGEENRGGYFFHIRQVRAGYAFYTFDKNRGEVWTAESAAEAAEFINQVSGRAYSERMWAISQRVNLRADEEAAGESTRDNHN